MKKEFKNVLFNKTETRSETNFKEVLKGSDVTKNIMKSSLPKVLEQPEPTINYRFLNNQVCQCLNIPEEFFINFLPERMYLDSYIDLGLKKIKDNPSLIARTEDNQDAPAVRYSGRYREHIGAIISEYDRIYGCEGKLTEALENGFIRKSKIKGLLENNGCFRLVSKYSKDISSGTTYFDLLFIDFYHLFVPSQHKGQSADQVRKKTYNDRKKNCTHELSEFLEDDCFEKA